jgi:hypothetical protein
VQIHPAHIVDYACLPSDARSQLRAELIRPNDDELSDIYLEVLRN